MPLRIARELEIQKIRLDLDHHIEEDEAYHNQMKNDHQQLIERMDTFIAQMQPMTDFFKVSGSLKRGMLMTLGTLASIVAIIWGAYQLIAKIFNH